MNSSPFETVLWVKVALSVALITASYLHNYVYGPRLQHEIREGQPERRRRYFERLFEIMREHGWNVSVEVDVASDLDKGDRTSS